MAPKETLSPGGRLRTQLLKGPIDFSYILFLCIIGNVFWVFKNSKIIGLFRFSKKLYFDGWVGCDNLPPSIFFIFRYVNNHNVLVQIWYQNLSNAFRSKVMIDLSLKFGKIKAGIIVVN